VRSDSSSISQSSSLGRRYRILEFWLVLTFPWVLDFFTGQRLFTSVFGALLWGVALALSSAHSKTRDPSLRSMLRVALLATSVIWLSYWAFLFFQGAGGVGLGASARGGELSDSLSLKYLVFTHAGLLAAGAGMIIVLLCSSFFWLLQEYLLRKSSWERRGLIGIWLPSLESLSRIVAGAINLSFVSWGLGFFLALLNANMHWKAKSLTTGEGGPWAWLADTKVLATALLWILLVVAFQLSHFFSAGNRWLYRFYFIISLLFLSFFTLLLFGGHYSQFHEPIGWFSR